MNYEDYSLANATRAVPQSAYSLMAEQDPSFVPAATSAVERMIDPRSQQLPDAAYGRASSHERGNQGVPDDETSAWEVAQAILKLPFGLLNEGRDFVQDTLNLPGAQGRQQAQGEYEMLQNMPQAQRQALGIDQISGFQTQSTGSGEASGTAGAPSSLGGAPQSTMKGFVEWTNNLGRDKAQQQMNQVHAAIKMAYATGKIGLQEAQRLKQVASAQLDQDQSGLVRQQTETEDVRTTYMPRQQEADLRLKGTGATANLAQAGASNANAAESRGRQQTIDEMRPSLVSEQQGKSQGVYDMNSRSQDQYWNSKVTSDSLGIEKQQQELDQGAEVHPLALAAKTAAANRDVAETNKAMGVYGNTGGVASGSQGPGSRETQIRKEVADALAGSGTNGRPAQTPDDVASLFDIPMKSGAHWWSDDVPDYRTGPSALKSLESDSPTSRPGQAIPLLPMPSTANSYVSGADVSRILDIFRSSGLGGYSEGEKAEFAQTMAGLLPSLRDADESTFAQTADRAGIPMDLAEAYWNKGRGR